MIRIFNLYVPTRTLVLLAGEIAAICASFALAVFIHFGEHSSLVFNHEHAAWKILGVALLALLCSHYLELHDSRAVGRSAVLTAISASRQPSASSASILAVRARGVKTAGGLSAGLLMITSTRRFCCRPTPESLPATGAL